MFKINSLYPYLHLSIKKKRSPYKTTVSFLIEKQANFIKNDNESPRDQLPKHIALDSCINIRNNLSYCCYYNICDELS